MVSRPLGRPGNRVARTSGDYFKGMKTCHLFAGAGGGLLADLILGHEPIIAVEWDAYCCQVLRERAEEGWFPGLQVFDGDVRLFPASDWAGRVDCVHAGFPCQPHSVAGKRKGAGDERNMWPECVRIIGEIRPQWVFLENVPGLVSNGFIGTVLRDLAGLGYDAKWTVLGADQVGAPHKRDRLFALAHINSVATGSDNSGTERKTIRRGIAGVGSCEMGEPNKQDGRSGGSWWTESKFPRMVYGIPHRMDRKKALGNAQVPLQSALAFKILMEQFK